MNHHLETNKFLGILNQSNYMTKFNTFSIVGSTGRPRQSDTTFGSGSLWFSPEAAGGICTRILVRKGVKISLTAAAAAHC